MQLAGDWHLDESQNAFIQVHFFIRTLSSQLRLWHFILDNLSENLDLLHVIDLFLISSKCHRSGACIIVGIPVYANLKSGLAYRNAHIEKDTIVKQVHCIEFVQK